MISLRRLSIPKKIVAITVLISAAALLMASAALIGNDYLVARRDLKTTITILARIAADQLTAAVSFNDRAAAMDTLNALHADPSIVAACVYSGDELFAERSSDPQDSRCPPSLADNAGNGLLQTITAPIDLKGKQIGTVRLRATLTSAYKRLRIEIATIGVVLLLSAIFALTLAARLHKVVSEPLLNLTRTANRVASKKDYSIQAVKDSDDELGTLVDSFNDMLAQIRLREVDLEDRTVALEAANQELRKAGKMKDEFLATLSHELRTPLTAIFGWINLLKAGTLSREKSQTAIEVIDRSARAQLQLVDDLLNVSQIITGKLKIYPQWTDAGSLLLTAVDSIQPAAAAKHIRVVKRIQDSAEPVFADPDRMQQVLWNLLTNAIKFSAPGTEIQVTSARVGDRFQVTVSDTGEGIDREFLPHLFERFTQADASRTRKHGGLGLGLAIVRHIVESHGGTVIARSEGKGRGSTFVVQLPIPQSSSDSVNASSKVV